MERALPSVNDGEPWVWESRQFKTFSLSMFQIFHNGYMMLLSYERKTLKKKNPRGKNIIKQTVSLIPLPLITADIGLSSG